MQEINIIAIMYLLQAGEEALNKGLEKVSLLTNLLDKFIEQAVVFGQKLLIVVIIFFIGRWCIKWLKKIFTKFINRKEVDITVRNFLISVVDALLKILLFIIIVNILGISTTSFAALLAAGGLAIGMAMKDNLSNFAGGVLLLLNRPFKVGEKIKAQGKEGTVQSIGILYTTMLTADNVLIYIPNGPLSTGIIDNFSTEDNRRVDITLGFNNGTDMEEIKSTLTDIINKSNLVLKDQSVFVGITNINNGSFDLTLRVWAKNSDYSTLSTYLNENIYQTFSEKGVYAPSSLTVKLVENGNA